jgi:hypothetical protein
LKDVEIVEEVVQHQAHHDYKGPGASERYDQRSANSRKFRSHEPDPSWVTALRLVEAKGLS